MTKILTALFVLLVSPALAQDPPLPDRNPHRVRSLPPGFSMGLTIGDYKAHKAEVERRLDQMKRRLMELEMLEGINMGE